MERIRLHWRVVDDPGEQNQDSQDRLVPLSRQAIAILAEAQQLTGPTGYEFRSVRTRGRPMSDNTINADLRRPGYKTDE